MDDRRLIPSMFHRRLVLLGSGLLLTLLGLSAQMMRLSVVEGSARLAEAESRLDRRTYLPTYRGEIRDRHGHVLARDRASYDIAVRYDVITGAWPRDQAARQARRAIGVSRWNTLSPEQRDQAIRDRMAEWTAKTDRLWAAIRTTGGLSDEALLARRDAIRAEVQSMAAVVWERQRMEWLALYGIEAEGSEDGFQPRPIREQRQPHVVLAGVSSEVAFEFERLSRELDQIVTVIDSRRREQPWNAVDVVLDRRLLPKPLRSDSPVSIRAEGVADHILGSVRNEVWAEDVERRPFVDPKTGRIDLGGYRVGDFVGQRGVELVFEDHLRGRRGVIHERRDTGAQTRTEPVPGENLQLTLDIKLQARVQAILSHDFGLTRVQGWHNNDWFPIGRPLNSAAVVLDVQTGEVLAMVSMPTMAQGENMSESRREVDYPWVNRPVEAVYPPGSIIKPLVLAAAVKEGVHALSAPITCTGHYYERREDIARCWIYRQRYGLATHGPLRAEEALARSCNIFFYTLSHRLGIERLAQWYRRFGLGQPLDIGLLHERARADGAMVPVGEIGGTVPDEQTISELRNRGELDFSSVIMGIGQGPVTWTPVQAANAYATIARGGLVRDATLVVPEHRATRRPQREDLQLSPPLARAILEGLRQSVEEPHGTGYQIRYDEQPELSPDRVINAPNVTVWAKTGTAQAPPLPVDTTGDGETDAMLREGSHAWFVGLVGPHASRTPTHAIAVVVEYGGSGGRVAGPIANQIILALQREGYLPAGDGTEQVAFQGRGARP